MERLLDIKEAAEILSVAEMTVRRWTNTGLLRCYRVGGKRERRFRIRDLQEYLEKGGGRGDASYAAPLGFGGLTAPTRKAEREILRPQLKGKDRGGG